MIILFINQIFSLPEIPPIRQSWQSTVQYWVYKPPFIPYPRSYSLYVCYNSYSHLFEFYCCQATLYRFSFICPSLSSELTSLNSQKKKRYLELPATRYLMIIFQQFQNWKPFYPELRYSNSKIRKNPP